MGEQLSFEAPDDWLETIALRVAELLTARAAQTPEPWVGVREASDHLGCKRQRIYDLVHRKDESGAERRERWVAGRGRLTLRWTATGVEEIAALRERAHPVLLNQNGAGFVRVALVEDLADLCERSPWSEDALSRAGLQAVLASERYSTRRPRDERLELA